MRKPPGIPNELFKYEREKRNWTQKDVADEIGAPVDERVIRRWESGNVSPTPHYRGKLAEVFGKSARALGFPPDGQVSFWHMPYRRNAFFTGREDSLQLLRDTFLAQHASPVPRLPLALSGLGGVGKSQIALEYAYRYREHYHTVLWLHAASDQDLVRDVTAAADLLDLPGKDEANPEQLSETLKKWLTQLTRWLLILDNVENLQLLEGFLPAEIKGHVLLTTRSQSTGTHAPHGIAVEPMCSDTGAELLLRRAKLIAIESTLEHAAAADAATARSLSVDMGGLPLALDQAGAYLEETAVSLSEYVQRYQKQRRDLLNSRGSWVGESEHPIPVAATLKLSFDKACERYPLASDILRFTAFLQPDAIPAELFQHDESFKYGTTVFDEAIAALLGYSLIRRNTQDQTFSIHCLVQVVLIENMPTDLQKQWRERVVRALNAAFPYATLLDEGYEDRRQCDRLLSYVLACAAWSEDELTPTLGVAELFHKACWYLNIRGRDSEAKSLLARALPIYEQHLRAEDPETAVALNNLAELCDEYRQRSQAEHLYQQALAILETHFGAEHPETVIVLHNLALLYIRQSKYGHAESLLARLLSILKTHLGADDLAIASALSYLALIYIDQSKYKEAAPFFQQAVAIYEKHFGAEYSELAPPLFVLSFFLDKQGEHEQAEALYQRAVSIQEQRIRETDPNGQTTMKYLSYQDRFIRIMEFMHSAVVDMGDDVSDYYPSASKYHVAIHG